MVKHRNENTRKPPATQAFEATHSEANKIGASTPYDFTAKNLTAVGGLLPVATMLEKLGFQKLVEEMVRGSLRIIAAITHESVIRRILRHCKLASVPPPIAPARCRQELFAFD